MKKRKGQAIVEVILALAVAVIAIGGLVVIVITASQKAQFSRDQVLATKFSTEGMEWIRNQRNISWVTFVGKSTANPGSNYCLNNISVTSTWPGTGLCSTGNYISGTFFQREVNLITLDTRKVQIKMTVSWSDSAGKHNSQQISFLTQW